MKIPLQGKHFFSLSFGIFEGLKATGLVARPLKDMVDPTVITGPMTSGLVLVEDVTNVVTLRVLIGVSADVLVTAIRGAVETMEGEVVVRESTDGVVSEIAGLKEPLTKVEILEEGDVAVKGSVLIMLLDKSGGESGN